MKLRVYLGCNSTQPRWLNRLRFAYMVPWALVAFVLATLMLALFVASEFVMGIGELKVAWINSGRLIKGSWETVTGDLWGAIKKAWNTGT